MHRFYLPPEQCQSDHLTLEGPEAHHALHVLRVRRAEQVLILDGAGAERLCQVDQTGRDTLTLRVREKHCVPPPPCQITLIQALPKGKLFESIVQKATELGVSRIVPLLSERSVAHLQGRDISRKTAKWQGVALEAIKQCGSAWLPKVEAPLTLQEVLAQENKYDLSFVGSLQPNAEHPRNHFFEFRRTHHRGPSSVCIWIGPEGDFTPTELDLIQSAAAFPITLGRLVLRTETAAIYFLSILNYELQAPSV